MYKNLLISLLFITLVGCSGGSDSDGDNPCSSAENIDNPECSKVIDNTGTDNVSLNLDFKDSYFYNRLEKEWKSVTKENLDGGLFGVSVPAYSSFLNLDPQEALDLVLIADDQQSNQERYNEVDFNIIPYIEVQYQSGVEYAFNYIKKDLNGNPVASVTGKMLVKNNRAILPLVNKMLGNQFYSSTDPIGKRYIHSIAISAQTKNQQGSTPRIVEFESTLQTPVTDFYVDYDDNMDNFSLDDRFSFYFNGTDNIPNQNFRFFTLREDDEPEAVTVDVRILFKEKPVLEVEQELFFEVPFNLDKFKTTNEVEVIRGESFYVEKVNLNSNDHFRLKVIMNNQIQNLTDGREFIVSELPAGTPWDLEFLYDFRQNESYNSQSGQPLITAYKPTCDEITNKSFNPLQAKQEKATAAQQEGFLSLCHPELNKKIFLSKPEIASTNLDLSDTFYSYFNYVPADDLKSIVGHFNGIRKVKFKLEGCMRVYVKTPTSSNWELKSKTSNACIEEGEENSEGWIYFNAEKEFTINNDIDNFDGVPGLRSLIQSFGSKPIRRTPHFKFNGLVNDTEHIY